MSCGWVKNLILDNNTKEIQIQLVWIPGSELHITSHWCDHHKPNIEDFGNRHWFSDGNFATTIVAAPNNCWKREVTSLTVYNPNASVQLFYIIEYDNDTNVTTVIDEKLLNPFETWTMECICSCWWSCGINVYDEWDFIYGNASNINFIGDCLNVEYNNITGMVDVNFTPSVLWSWCNGDDPYKLSICWIDVDLSCLAQWWSWCPCPIEIDLEAFVMENGDDITGVVGRLDLPFRSIRAAILAGAKKIIMYAGIYTETNSIAIDNNNISIYAYPGVWFSWSFDVKGNASSLKIDWEMNRVKPSYSNTTYYYYITLWTYDWTNPWGYNIDININRIDLSWNKLLYNTSQQNNISFSFITKKSFKAYQSIYAPDNYIIECPHYYIPNGVTPPQSCDANRLNTRQINVSLWYFSIVMSPWDTITEYTPYVNIIKCWLGNNIRVFDTTLQEDISTVNDLWTHDFWWATWVKSKCGQISNIIWAWSYVELDNFNIVGRFTAQWYDYDTSEPSRAMFLMMGTADTAVARLMFRNCKFSLSKTWESWRTYRLVQSKIYDWYPEWTAAGFVEFDWVNTFYESKRAISEFKYSLPASTDDTYMNYYSNSWFLITNMLIQLSPQALNANHHTHWWYKHIICTLHEPATWLLEPIIHTDYAI